MYVRIRSLTCQRDLFQTFCIINKERANITWLLNVFSLVNMHINILSKDEKYFTVLFFFIFKESKGLKETEDLKH